MTARHYFSVFCTLLLIAILSIGCGSKDTTDSLSRVEIDGKTYTSIFVSAGEKVFEEVGVPTGEKNWILYYRPKNNLVFIKNKKNRDNRFVVDLGRKRIKRKGGMFEDVPYSPDDVDYYLSHIDDIRILSDQNQEFSKKHRLELSDRYREVDFNK